MHLDDVEVLATLDRQGMFNIQAGWPHIFLSEWKRMQRLEVEAPEHPDAVAVCGMGGSGVCGDLLASWLELQNETPVYVWKDYGLPKYLGRESLVVAVSHSGNTVETLSSFSEAVRRGIPAVVVTSGGQLQRQAKKHSSSAVLVPPVGPPRAALPYLFVALATVVNTARVVEGFGKEMANIGDTLETLSKTYDPARAAESNDAKRSAVKLSGYIPAVFASTRLRAVAHRVKTVFNENSKYPAKAEIVPELKHNDIVSWEGETELSRRFMVVMLRDSNRKEEHEVDLDLVRDRILRRRRIRFIEAHGKGDGMLARMFSLIYWGDYVSLYLAVLEGRDPSITESIRVLKSARKQSWRSCSQSPRS